MTKFRNGIWERSPGRWAIVLDVRDPATGKRKRKWHSFKGGKRQAEAERIRLVASVNGGTYSEPSKTTVAAFLDQWLGYMKERISPRSHERYSELVEHHVKPAIGAVIVTKLRPSQIASAYTKAMASGRRDGQGGLSANTVLYLHRIIKQALAHAVRWELLTRNPADAVDPPKVERARMSTYDVPQTAELLDSLRGTRLFVPVLLGVMCGLRRGEIAALRWGRVDLAAGRLAVVESAEQTGEGVRYKEPKSGRARTVSLATMVVEELRQHRIRQSEELLRLGVRLADDTFVYAREDGQPMQPRSLSQAWQLALKTMALPRIRFHDLRHAHATHLMASGVHPKIASERLGHSKVGITLDLYSHVLDGMQEDAAARVDDAVQAALQKRQSKDVR